MNENGVSQRKEVQLATRMLSLGLRESDIVEQFVRGAGRGGQKLNKTSSCVYIRHLPSGIQVKCQWSRSRSLNRFLARRELCDRYAERVLKQRTDRQMEVEKIRRQKRRRSRRQRERMLQDKHRASERKALRGRVHMEDGNW